MTVDDVNQVLDDLSKDMGKQSVFLCITYIK